MKLADVLYWFQNDIPNEKQATLGVEKYIISSHIDRDQIHIKRWGSLSDGQKGPTITKEFHQGDLLLSTRSVALRKASIALINGVTSEKILVLRTKDNSKLSSDLKPFIFHTDRFWNYAQLTASGSVNKFTSWNKIKNYEFLLPPLEEQQRIANLLYTIEEAIERAAQQERALLKYKQGVINHLFQEDGSLGNLVQPHDVKPVTFKNLAQHISKRVEPQDTDLEIYVGLEHLNPDDLKIRRHGAPQDVKGTKLLVEPGDVIFGKRRAYQRKVAVADFHGICSAHAMVLRAKPEQMAPEFLPYLMQSDMFMNRAVQISEGSLSPTIKWKVLAQQTFYCPIPQKQHKIVDILKNFDQALEQTRQHQAALIAFKKGLLNALIG